MKVQSLAKYRNKELIAELEELLRMAQDGEISAVAAVVRFGPHDHRAGMFGSYKEHPSAALEATFILENRLRGEMLPIYGSSL